VALRVVTMTELKRQIIHEPRLTGESVTEVCARWGISRDTFYRYRRRFQAAGDAGLQERSRAPITSPNRMDSDLEELICRMRKDHPRWGARRIRAELLRAGIAPPAVSTIHQALRRNYLVADHPRNKPRRLLRRFERDEPNDLWQIDATEIRLRDGKKAYVVDIIDDHARFLLAAVACRVPTAAVTCACFEQAARRYGLPRQVLSDNHNTFTGRLYGFEVAFERLLATVEVKLINGAPSHPQTQGKVERFHKTLKDWLADHGGAKDVAHLQRLLDRFRRHYNIERPNQAIADLTPAERYRRSPRIYRLPAQITPTYPRDAIVRRVDRNGLVCYDMNHVTVERRWAGCTVRIVPRNGRLQVFFGDTLLRDVPHFREGGRHPLTRPSRPAGEARGA
jgi:transposase InsO family protein